MDKKELRFILQEGEGYNLEFKESIKHLSKEMVAFANSSGGRIFVGVTDEGIVKEIIITNRLKSQVQDMARNCDPEIKVKLETFKSILIINVLEGNNKPHKCKEGFFLRVGANSQKMTRNQIIKLVIDEGKVKFDEHLNEEFNFNKDFDKNKFNEFLRKSNLSKIDSVQQTLVNLSLAKVLENGFFLNNAGILFFGKNQFFRQNFVTCVLYKGKERVNIIDRKDFTGDLISNYDDSINFLKQHLKLQYIIKGAGPRREVLEIPEEALRESVLNALIHRDYFDDRYGVFIEIFDDRVEINNKGRLLFDKENLGKISFPRNPLLFDMFHRLGLIEKVGSGINRIKKLVGRKVKFEIDDFFRVIFLRKTTLKTTLKTTPKNNEKILELLKQDPNITKKELADSLNITVDGVKYHVKQLRKQGIIKWKGSSKRGHWEIIKENINKG